ncbi:THUMP domain-containing class I SAM-dependent RNA methyltransferase [Melissococcus plutonius]|uniref:Predicted N6-adenine-specific DNA methylase n=1 Tax=Melissococcus plutonius (strain ATCC 35311 / DSM 29964 / CIP 104052 / LMG 20360 / NCIMB 702443) TaxID=940190 RepID=F3YAF6_MELPT|nr:class I SAM-dependent RNA methyltransferase [Melissococcus plutonius]AIM24961.1 putative RNA methyltransferase YpsC [Melissococcus plutonius S1]KMT25110.1 putative RNA methyltransferase YpsC [Melissococcus plutonius]KMT26747.1 putative RNA methyltransferase YpsC [Melissococcus plutonius]KMT27997.1 putative RNA methyltransferase YpsC [Melissococcus plutonius]KMT29770.1 putative RNA methyltransferase YpsC [Melissococcus plutonius]
MTNEKIFNLMATSASGIEALVGKELRALDIPCQVENGKALFQGTQTTIATTNLWLRTADRIKIVIGEFSALSFDELFEKVKALPWEDYLPLGAKFPVAGKSIKSKLYSVPDCQAITKKAIVERLKSVYHRPSTTPLPETGALFQIEVALLKDQVTLTIDTTGPSLFKRGYRLEKGGAPLKETMAAALVMLTNWRKDRPFYDPVCGSGTICIEAALIGRNIAPGFNRSFTCETWDWFDEPIFKAVREKAKYQADYEIELDITGSDINGKMIDIAHRNAQEANLESSITFKQLAVKDFKTTKDYGVMVANPPYGERLGEEETVHQLYKELGKVFQPLDTWSKYILTSDLGFETDYGEKATKKRKLYNGALRIDLFQYWGKRLPRKNS